jgi:chromosome segregation ATPase
LGNNQTGLTQAVKAGLADLGARTDKIATEVTAVNAGQNSLKDTLNHQGQTVSGQMAKIADGQQQMQSSLNTLTATTGQTALDVIAMTARQNAIRTALQSHDEAASAQMAKLADHQQQMQSGLDTVTAVTGQASLDTLTLNNGQGQLGQAVQAGRQETAAKLAAMAQDQQNWSNRLDAAQAKIATIADSIAALEQQIGKLQGVLQTSIQGTATIVGATSQQRMQFEAKVSQDVQAVIDSLAQLRQTQSLLQEQITQVQRSTQGQADSIRSAIEQMKPAPSVTEHVRDNGPAPAEIKISAAAEKPQSPAAVESVPESAQ